jgi:hypothetical protein
MSNSNFELSKSISGTLHSFVAFDWGEEVDLDEARKLAPAELTELARRSRTPSSFEFRPAPVRFPLAPMEISLPELGVVQAAAEATLFDFGAVSIALHVPFTLGAENLVAVADGMSQPEPMVQKVRAAIESLYQRLQPAIRQPLWAGISEEYFVFQLPPDGPLPPPRELLSEAAPWLASLVRLEDEPLSSDEVMEALRLRISYSPADVLVADWSATVLLDRDCDETLQTIEFANVQLLELRHIDARIDRRLEAAYQTLAPFTRSWLPFWRTHTRPLRAIGELKVEANGLFERTHNALKLVGDPYLARVYRLLSTRFHLEAWEQSIRESLEVAQGIYQVLADQAATYRTELLEIIIIALIAFEIVMAFVRG